MKVLAALLSSIALSTGAFAQYDRLAPEPIDPPRGGLLLLVGPAPARMLDRLQRQSGEGLLVVVDPPESERAWDADAFLPDWKGAKRRSTADPDDEAWPTDLAKAHVVWIRSNDGKALTAAVRATRLATALRAVRAGGGTVVLEGAAVRAAGEVFPDSEQLGLGWLPGTVVDAGDDVHASGRLTRGSGLVGIGLRGDCALWLEHRRLFATGDARAWLTKGPLRAERSLPIGARPLDLLALSRSARVRQGAAQPAAAQPAPVVPSGALMLGGGGRLTSTAIARFIELAGGPDAPLVVIPCTEAETLTRQPGDVDMLRRAGARNVTWIHTKDRRKADTDEGILKPLREARGIWFGGGRQWNLVDSYQHTEAHKLMHGVLARGGVIGGSSAGASIQAAYLCRGDPLGNLNIIAEGYESGLGFLPGVGVDQHFSQRKRQKDMEELVSTYPQLLGLGLDEGVMLVVQGSVGTAIGGQAWFYDAARAEDGEQRPVTLDDGERYDLVKRAKLGD